MSFLGAVARGILGGIFVFLLLYFISQERPIKSETMYEISSSCGYSDVVAAYRAPIVVSGQYKWYVECSNGDSASFIGDS